LSRRVEVTTNDVKARQAEPNDDDKEMHISLIYYRQLLTVPASTPGGIIEEARKHLRSEADDVNVDHRRIGAVHARTNFLKRECCTFEWQGRRSRVFYGTGRRKAPCGRIPVRIPCDTFKRDYLLAEYDSTHPDSECIKEGNRQAHDPDPLGDADLHLHGHRSDENAFKALYGISPLRVNALSESCHDHTVWQLTLKANME
jgi:hypothetical protein